jgi:hypothetical protein
LKVSQYLFKNRPNDAIKAKLAPVLKKVETTTARRRKRRRRRRRKLSVSFSVLIEILF